MAITSQAEHFLNAYHVLKNNESMLQIEQERRAFEHNKQNPDKKPVQAIGCANDLQTGVVSFVCLAFAVELYLKATYEVLRQEKWGHNIKELFEDLPPYIKQKIFEIHQPNAYGASLDTYTNQMEIISKGFEEFRYAYEYKTLMYHQGFAIKMIDAIKAVIQKERNKKAA